MPRCCVVALPVLLLGCNTAQKNCEHARDVLAAMAEQSAKEALATVDPRRRGELEKDAKAEVERLRATFVGHCMALDDEGKECIARIDDFKRIDAELDVAIASCAKDTHGVPDDLCRKQAIAAAEEKLGTCKAELDALTEKVFGGL